MKNDFFRTKWRAFRKWFSGVSNDIVRLFKARSISTQMILTIILIFASFFVLQSILNVAFFRNFYTTQEFDRIHNTLMDYIDEMNQNDTDYYDEMYAFTTEHNAYSVIVDGRYRVLRSSTTNYTVTIEEGTTTTTYRFLVPDNDHEYDLGESITATLYPYADDLYAPAILEQGGTPFYNAGTDCTEETCFEVSGTVTSIDKPNNMNYVFDENNLIQHEIAKLSSNPDFLDEFAYDSGGAEGYWYRSTDGPIDSLVFVHNLKTWNWIVTVVPIVDTGDVIDIVSNYNYYVYATAIVIIFIWSFRISTIMSKPIRNIELVAREIARLNFNVEAKEFNNKENESLSRSINLIASNLKTTLETLNTKNQELLSLYDEQSKQVSLKKQLVSSISHELKTPLMIMQVTIQAILDGIIPDAEQEKELNNLLLEINKSSMMIQDMLQIYRLDDANTKLDICEFDLAKTVRFFQEDFQQAIRRYELNVDANLQDDAFVEADQKLIKRVISNFLTNAIKYTPTGGDIYIEVSDQGDRIYFELTNYGTTIADEDMDKIWMPFYRTHQEELHPSKTKGSGIGLYLVSEILKAHNAEFGIDNVKNGVKAYFYLPKKMDV
jgi:signal transduction histidine kinase